MKLYHYSTEQLSELQTRRIQGVDLKEIDISAFKARRMGLPFPYQDHISFFFEPIPVEHIASTFAEGHPFWKSGLELYEHVIDLTSIEPNSFWRVVESIPQSKFSDQFDWGNVKDLAIRAKWFTKMYANDVRIGLAGWDTRLIYKAYRNIMTLSMLDFYRRAAVIRFVGNTQYAAYVPHLMVYPVGGRVPIVSCKKVTLGNRKADPVLFHLSFRDLPNTLIPRQPEDSGDDESVFTEKLPARVSFAPTIQQAFGSIYPNISKFFEEDKLRSIKLKVYSPVGCATLPVIPQDEVRAAVWDSEYTGEVCYTAPVKVVCVGEVTIHNPYIGKRIYQDIEVHPFGNVMIPKKFVCPEIRFDEHPLNKSSIIL